MPSAAPDAERDPGAATDSPNDEPLVAAILLSDGANSVGEAEPLDAAERAASPGRADLHDRARDAPTGRSRSRTSSASRVTLDVPPDTETLAQIAEITEATAFDAPTAKDLQTVYDNLQSRVGFDRGAAGGHGVVRRRGALLLVVLGAGLSALWFGRLP